MKRNILTYFSKTGTSWLHPKESTASALLLQKLELTQGMHILELGFGTGATLVQMCIQHPEAHLHGLEKNQDMFAMAKKRMQWCRLSKNVDMRLMDDLDAFPYPPVCMHVVYAESVLALAEGEELRTRIEQIYSVLLPGGTVYVNELVWMEQVPVQRRIEMNTLVKEHFGIIQANAEFPCISDWKALFEENGFEIMELIPLDAIQEHAYRFPFSFAGLRSNAFTLLQKLRCRLNGDMRREWKSYQRAMKNIHAEKSLEPWLICARKK